jgi:hypothetical protein
LSGQPSALTADSELLRRIISRGLARDGSIKAICFNLRTSQREMSLSLYLAKAVDPAALVAAAGALPGMGAISIRAHDVEASGFSVNIQVDKQDPVFGEYHVAATPFEYDDDGQIPLDLRVALASKAVVVLEPDSNAKT